MNHNDIRHKLSDYLDGAVPAGEKAEIEAHLTSCAECGNALNELRKTVAYIRETEEVEPPAWMTAKIMAKVRAGAEEKKGIFRRFFSPLRFTLPVRTVAILFLVVTAYFLYQQIQPADRFTEAPREVAAKKDAPAAGGAAGEAKAARAPAPAKKVEQEPGYKSLDMKYEYEKPAPPVPLGEAAAPAPAPAAPAPAQPEERTRLRDEAPAAGQERAEPSPGIAAEKRAKAAPAPQMRAMASAVEPEQMRLTLIAPDAARAAKEIEGIVPQLGGRVVSKKGGAETPVFTILLGSDRTRELATKLAPVGELTEKDALAADRAGTLQIELTILPRSRP